MRKQNREVKTYFYVKWLREHDLCNSEVIWSEILIIIFLSFLCFSLLYSNYTLLNSLTFHHHRSPLFYVLFVFFCFSLPFSWPLGNPGDILTNVETSQCMKTLIQVDVNMKRKSFLLLELWVLLKAFLKDLI